jgi:hypothetical protein
MNTATLHYFRQTHPLATPPCRGQPFLSHTEQNLNGCVENGVYACGRTRLNRAFTGL